MNLKQKALALPTEPGVYIMKNDKGIVIYVGKAKALKNRVSNYFQDGAKHTSKTRRLVANIADFDVIVVTSEREALVLECELIRKHNPRYNVWFKNYQGFPYIKLPVKEEYPRLSLTLKWAKDGSKYFGPYMTRTASKSVLQHLESAMRLPNCGLEFPRDIGKRRPCLNFQMNRCVGVCTGDVSSAEYHGIMRNIALIMEGKYQTAARAIQDEMDVAAEALNFEAAAMLRDRYNAVVALGQRQKVVSGSMSDHDVIGIYEDADRACVAVLHYANGMVFDKHTETLDAAAMDEPSIMLGEFVKQFYIERNRFPKEIILSHDIEDRELFAEILVEKADHKVEITVPKRGEKKALADLAVKNAKEQMEWQTTAEEKTSRLLESLQKTLGLSSFPKRIEACDISNTGDVGIVGALTVFVNGVAKKGDYKLYKVKELSHQDDYHSMQEVLTRRFRRLQAALEDNHGASAADGESSTDGFAQMPDLLLVDGGAAHANMAKTLTQEMGLFVPVFGMVKNEKHKTRGLVTADGEELTLPPHLFSFIGRIQEETHRFAVQFHRNQRGKTSYSSILDKIDGVGPARRAALLTHFKSMKKIRAATLEELCIAVPYPVAKLVYEFLQDNKDE